MSGPTKHVYPLNIKCVIIICYSYSVVCVFYDFYFSAVSFRDKSMYIHLLNLYKRRVTLLRNY